MLKIAPKIPISTFLSIFIAQMLALIVLLAVPVSTQAITFEPQVDIPTKEFQKIKDRDINENTIGYYIKSVYKYAIGVVGVLAAVVLMVGGIVWLTAGGNQTRIGEAKAWIGASITGLIIALASYMILWTVNPALVQFRPIEVKVRSNKSSDGFSADTTYLNIYKLKCASVEKCNYPWSTTELNILGDTTYCGDILIKDTDTCLKTWVCCQCLSSDKEYCEKVTP